MRATCSGGGRRGGANARRCSRTSTIRLVRRTCLRLASRAPPKRTAPGSPSASPLPRGPRASQSTSRSLATTTNGSATWHSPSAQRPSHIMPSRWPCCGRALGAARACAWCCAPQSLLASASRGATIASRLAAASRARRSRRASATRPRARRAATPLARGPARQRPCCCSGPIPPATRTCPNWRHPPARATPCPAWASNAGVPLMTGDSATPRSLWTPCSTAQGAERMRRTPHWTPTGSAGVTCSAMPVALRQ